MTCYLLFKEPMKYLVPRGSGRPMGVGVPTRFVKDCRPVCFGPVINFKR